MVGVIIAIILCLSLCAILGTFFNYIGVELMRCAFEMAGGDAIGTFFGGLLIVIISLVTFVIFALCLKLLIVQIKYILKGGAE